MRRVVSCWFLLPVTLCCACRSFTGFPHSGALNTGDSKTLADCFADERIVRCHLMKEEETCRHGGAQAAGGSQAAIVNLDDCLDRLALVKKQCRNELVDCRIRAIDLAFVDFERSLNEESNAFNFSSDVTIETLTAAATLLSGTSAKILSALAGIGTGAKTSIDKNVYYTKTLPALMLTMEATRSKKLTDIRLREKEQIDTYSLDAALSEVDSYYSAGSIPAALIEISATAGNTKSTSDLEREKATTSDTKDGKSAAAGKDGDAVKASGGAIRVGDDKHDSHEPLASGSTGAPTPPAAKGQAAASPAGSETSSGDNRLPESVEVRVGAGPLSIVPKLPAIAVDKTDAAAGIAEIHYGKASVSLTRGGMVTGTADGVLYAITLVRVSADACTFAISRAVAATKP
jgi:hypothetical protein